MDYSAIVSALMDGQKRRAWLDRQDAKLTGAANYYLGPLGAPLMGAAKGAAMLSPGADMQDMAQAGGDLMRSQSLGDAGRAGLGLGAATLGMAIPGTAKGVTEAAEGVQQGIRAYHGSPHDFDRFSMDKIGTGEGAQAYGHGLYFAEGEEVAKSYRDNLTVRAQGVPEDLAAAYGRYASGNGFLVVNGQQYSSAGDVVRDISKGYLKASDLPGDLPQAFEAYTSPGHMYEVNINANPDDFLDWDAPLSAQPQSLQEMARQADLSSVPTRLRRQIEAWRGEYTPPDGLAVDEPTGNQLHSALTDFGTDTSRNSTMTERLREAGIPGIRYLDQGSRGAGDGSRNYVVFDDSLISILRKYGLAGGMVLGGGMMMQGQEIE